MEIPKFTFTESKRHTIKLYEGELKFILRALQVYAEQKPLVAIRANDIARVLTYNL